MKQLNEKQLERFLKKVKKGGEDDCWLWTGTHSTDGYGLVRLDGKLYTVHRIAYEAWVGEIPSGKHLIRISTCKARDCVNPKHLIIEPDSAEESNNADPEDIFDYFWKNARGTDSTKNCWSWAGKFDEDGYPIMYFGRKRIRAERVAYELYGKTLPHHRRLIHKCGFIGCVNPNHIILLKLTDEDLRPELYVQLDRVYKLAGH